MDIRLALQQLLPESKFNGTVSANTEVAWNRVEWQDSRRSKPTWKELKTAYTEAMKEQRITEAQVECTQRIEQEWNTVGQINAALGVYTQSEIDDCKNHVDNMRTKFESLKTVINDSNEPSEIDVSDDKWW